MPYNTRRKSLSLPLLGIQLPNTSRSHRSPSTSKLPSSTDDLLPPSKKVKRSHDSEFTSPDNSTLPTPVEEKGSMEGGRLRVTRVAYEHTPPPSPADEGVAPKIDTEGITDDVVIAAIEQLEKTGNRPHMLRELAAVLLPFNNTVASATNPSALVSARLCAYLKRPWTALSPCPVAKELISIRSRKVLFYYLTTYPHQPFPDRLDDLFSYGKRVTPSLSSASVDQDDEDAMARDRSRLSPSPEIDLSSPVFEADSDRLDGQAGSGSVCAHGSSFSNSQNLHRFIHHRAVSPPLEGDEKEFTQTASSVRERASEEKASREFGIGDSIMATFTSGHDLNGDSIAFTGSPMDEDPLSSMNDFPASENEYLDYSYQPATSDQGQRFDEMSAASLSSISPSPSLMSVLSLSLSSGTSATSDATAGCRRDVTEVDPATKLSAVKATSQNETPVSFGEDSLPSVMQKRTFDMDEANLCPPGVGIWPRSHPQRTVTQPHATFDFEIAIDSWRDLRDPETVEVDELDEMFGDI